MPHLFTADYLYTPEGFVQNHVLEVDETGQILDFRPRRQSDKPQHFKGILSPGFVNAHCHLELSALQGKIPRGTSMADFGGSVYAQRKQLSEAENQVAIRKAIRAAYDSGTQVIGDICNDATSLEAKAEFPELYVHNFVEVFGSRPDMAAQIMQRGKALLDLFPPKATLTLHAPYSASADLLAKFKTYFEANPGLASLHLWESRDERQIFEEGSGVFVDFYKALGIDFKGFGTESPFDYLKDTFAANQPLLFVHLLEAQPAELKIIHDTFPQAYFCLCPASNGYIHGRIPLWADFEPYAAQVCLGTDSLASNDSLEMWKEVVLLHKQSPKTPIHQWFQLLTTNGAKALGVFPDYGLFAVGNRCGVLNVKGIDLAQNQMKGEVERVC